MRTTIAQLPTSCADSGTVRLLGRLDLLTRVSTEAVGAETWVTVDGTGTLCSVPFNDAASRPVRLRFVDDSALTVAATDALLRERALELDLTVDLVGGHVCAVRDVTAVVDGCSYQRGTPAVPR